jgi:hypothetical protein
MADKVMDEENQQNLSDTQLKFLLNRVLRPLKSRLVEKESEEKKKLRVKLTVAIVSVLN